MSNSSNNEFVVNLVALLQKQKSRVQVNKDIKELEKLINKIKLVGILTKGTTKAALNQTIKEMEAQLRQVRLQARIDNRQLNREINNALRNVSARDIQLNINSNSERLGAQVRRAVSQAREIVERSPISVNIDLKREKLLNQLTTFLNKNTKINESSYWLGEAERLRGVISSVTNRDELRNATDQLQVFTSGVRATGYAAVSTSDRIKNMLGNVLKIGNYFGLAFTAVNKFRQSLSNLKNMDTLLTEISKTSEMTVKQLEKLGDRSYGIASKYGVLANNFMKSFQEMSRAGFGEDKAQPLAELATLAQSAGDLTAELANEYLIASNAAYGYSGNVEQLNALLDAQNQVTNRNAVSMTELADATKVAANQLANSNISENEMTALLGTGIATTKESGQVVGRAVKAIVMNLQQVQNTEEGLETTAEDLGKVESRLESLGIKMKETADGITRLRNPVAILSELAEAYNSLPKDSAERTNIISDIGGKYRGNVLSSILSNWETYIKMLGDYEDATGSALREAEKSADSWEGRLAQLSNSWDAFVASVTSKDAIKGGISFLDNMIQSFTKLTDTIGALPMLLATVNGSLTALNKNYGLTQLVNWQTRRIDVRGNIMGFDISAYRDQVQHFRDASEAMQQWNDKLANGTADINTFGSAVVSSNEQLKAYLQTTSVDAPASLRGYRSYLNAAGVSTDALRLKTVLLNTALSLLAGLTVQAVITGITKAIDKFNVTVTEAQEEVDGVNSKIEELKSQMEELNNLEYKSDFDKQKIQQLEKELELQKRILEVEQKRLYQNQIGTSFSDYFDEESLITKQMSEYDRYNKEGYTYLSMRFRINDEDIKNLNDNISALETDLANEVNAVRQEQIQDSINRLTQKRSDILEEQQDIEEQLTLNMGEYLTNYQMAKEAVDSGLLDGDDLTKAEEMADYWNQIYQDSSLMVMNIQKANGTYDNTNDLLKERFGNISETDLFSLSADDKRIALSFDPDNAIGFEELQQKIEEAKNGIVELNDTEVSPTLSISETVTKLDELKEKFDTIDKTYSKLFDSESEIGFEDLSSINEAFADVDGIDDYIKRLQEAGQDTEAVTKVMEDLIDSYIQYSGILENVTDENRQLIIATLEEMGVVNAEAVVNGELTTVLQEVNEAKQQLGITTEKLSDLTLEEIQRLIEEGNCSEQTKNKLYELYLTQIDLNNNPIDATASINQLLRMVDASSAAGIALTQLGSIMGKIGQMKNYMNSTDGNISKSLARNTLNILEQQADTIKSNALAEFAKNTTVSPNVQYKVTPKSNYKGGSGTQKTIKDEAEKAAKEAEKAAKEAKDVFEETVDFFEQRVKVLDNALSLLKTNLDNVTGSFAKNKLVDAELGITEEKFKNYSDALNMYTQKANEALSRLPSDIAEKVKDGAVDLTIFIGDGNEEVVEAIKDYEQWADKVADCKQELAELRKAIRQLELEKFNNIMEDFNNQFDLREDGKDLITKQIDLLKEAGQLIGESFFTTQIDQSQKQLELLENEKKQLVDQMSVSISSGRVQKGTDEWLEMVNALSDVEGNILDCKKAIEEFDNELLELNWQIFERVQTQFGNISSELDNLAGLFDGFNDIRVSDGKGTWTKEAIATLGLYAQQYELAQYQVQQYNDAINKLNEDYSNGRYSATEYMDKLADLSKGQWDAVNSAESLEDAIYSLNETRVNEEIDVIEKEIVAYKELVDAQIDALKASKDLHDYEQSIAEKTKSVTDLERQIAAMQNDNTAATVAKRKQLEEQLADAKKELEEAEYDHSIEAQENALNKQYEEYEKERNAEIEALKASLEERENLIAQSFETVKANADLVGKEIALIATEHGITVSNAIITSWQNGENAIAGYGTVLSENTSAFIGNLMGVESEVYNLQAQANMTADTLSYMFATRADNLVGELAASYYSEQNLGYMTQALHDSLVRTLESGYNISGITSALSSIAGGLNSVASAANNAAQAIASMGSAQAGVGSSSSSGSGRNPIYDDEANLIAIVPDSKLEQMRKSGQVVGNTRFYASGTRNARGGLRVINEEGKELTLPKLSSGNYAIGNEGDQILTKEQTDNVYEWSKVSPDEFAERSDKPKLLTLEEFAAMHGVKIPDLNTLAGNAIYDVPYSVSHPKTVNDNVYSGGNVNIHYDNMINIQGDVNDASHVVKQIENVASSVVDKAIKKSWHDFDMTRKYGTY